MAYDVVVVGLGAMGSAALYQLAKAGANVLGVDQYSPPHALGSTHGDTRITRVAVGEGPAYVPLVRRSHEIWREIESQTGLELFDQCGALVMGSHQGQEMHGTSNFLDTTIAVAREFGIDHRTLTADEIGRRYPAFALSGDETGSWEPGAGFVRPERCVEAQLQLARRHGATIRTGERVEAFEDTGSDVHVTVSGEQVTARTLIVTAGPWVSALIPDLSPHLRVFRQVLYWFDLVDKSDYEAYRQLPVYIWWNGGSRNDMIYGFPMVDGPGGGAKVSREVYAEDTTVNLVNREVPPEETEEMYETHVRDRLPGLSSTCVKTRSCLYTVTPDSRFIIDVHPTHRSVIVASPCSGHGFKHSGAIGECLAQLAMTGASHIDLSSFRYPAVA